ncbi:MAG: helix-turn-helix transcriptional regulator [Oscillospiraceae bacterium]|nr:helix-turn-helix transcriptional regulator [Oscillospiraceae bacterium]
MFATKLDVEEIRKQKGISLSELSRRSGIAKSTLFYIELNATDPKLSTICKIAKALDVPAGMLFSCDKSKYDAF